MNMKIGSNRAVRWAAWAIVAVLAIVAVINVASYVVWRLGENTSTTVATTEGLYHCPMHPTYTSDRPGECPICGMALEPISSGTSSHAGQGDVEGLTGIHLSSERIQLIGVRTTAVEKRPLGSAVELVGFVAPDESRLERVQIRVAGWVQELFVNRTGERVRAGEPLLRLYSPELYQSEQEFLIEVGAIESGLSPRGHGTSPDDPRDLRSARKRLELLGVPDDELARLEKERTASDQLTLRSPVSGTVLERGVVEGQYVGPNTPLLTVADLSRVWVLADLYERDLPLVKKGDRASFSSEALPGAPLESRIEFVYPTVSSETRTVKARLSFENKDGLLKPGMYGRVRVRGRGGEVLAVPVEAVVRTGERDYVFIDEGDGHFEPRAVTIGAQDGEWVQVTSGLTEGETVVASSAFLIDSESRLRAAISGMAAGASSHDHGGTP